ANKLQGLKEGPANLRVHARDYSFSRLFKGNETVFERTITVDLTPPSIDLLADDRYINFGGVGAIVYKVSDTGGIASSGVKVGEQNEDKIREVTGKASPAILWSGAFSQLSNSKVEANFADRRTYTYNGEAIDTAYHLGYDLSVTKHYPIEAANSGVVAFTGDLGIYGNAVIIDHGLGLFSLYVHLSSIVGKYGDSAA